jgi:hypothetical protein
MTLRTIYLAVVLAVLSACGGSRPDENASAAPRVGVATAADRVCSRDLDCVLVEECCGCASSGQRLAVSRARLEALESAAASVCTAPCMPVLTAHRSCTATEARCAGGLCVPVL